MASWESLIKPTLDLLRSGLGMAKRARAKQRYEKLLSEVIRELLKGSPDFDLLEAHWAKIKETGVLPGGTYVRARRLYRNALAHRDARTVVCSRKDKTDVGKSKKRLKGGKKEQ